MNVKLDRRLGRIWLVVEQQLSMDEVNKFREAAFKAKDFNNLPQAYKDLV